MVYLLFFYTHYAVRGGASSNSIVCGTFCVYASLTADFSNWGRGAAL